MLCYQSCRCVATLIHKWFTCRPSQGWQNRKIDAFVWQYITICGRAIGLFVMFPRECSRNELFETFIFPKAVFLLWLLCCEFVFSLLQSAQFYKVSCISVGTFKQTGMAMPTSGSKMFFCNPHILLSISLLWLPCMFLFLPKISCWLQHLLLNKKKDFSSWNVAGHILKTAWKWSSWSVSLRAGRLYFRYNLFADIAVAVLGCFCLRSLGACTVFCWLFMTERVSKGICHVFWLHSQCQPSEEF